MVLMSPAARSPHTKDELPAHQRSPAHLIERHARAPLRAFARPGRARRRMRLRSNRPPTVASAEHRLDAWTLAVTRAEVCSELQVAPELALPSRWTRMRWTPTRAAEPPPRQAASVAGRKSLLADKNPSLCGGGARHRQ